MAKIFLYGRVYPLATAATIQLIVGLAAGFAPWFWLFAILRFLVGLSTGGTMVPSFALLLEFTPRKWRTLIGIWYTIPVHIGHALLGLVGYLWRRWDYDQIAVSLWSVLLLFYWILPESVRWLLKMQRTDKVVKVLEHGAKCNKLPTDQIKPMVDNYVSRHDVSAETNAGSLPDLFKTGRMRTKTLVLCLIWFATSLSFYAIGQYCGRIPGNVFVNTAIVGGMQIPANLVGSVVVGFVGRKWTVILSYLLTIVPMLVVGFLPNTAVWPIVILGAAGMCGAAINFSMIYVYTGELLPTMLRSVGMGLCSMTGRVGSIVSPNLFNLPVPDWMRPMFFVIAPILALICTVLFLPETMNQPLADTVEEADKL